MCQVCIRYKMEEFILNYVVWWVQAYNIVLYNTAEVNIVGSICHSCVNQRGV